MEELNSSYLPFIVRAASMGNSDLPVFQNRFIKNKTLIYVCSKNACMLPFKKVSDVLSSISL